MAGRNPQAPTSGRGRFRNAAALAAGAALVLAAALPVPAAAAPDEPASGLCKLEGETSWAGWTDHAELGDALAHIAANSDGRVTLDTVGRSTQGRELWAARVGHGDRVLLVTSAIHGNERTGTEAALGMLTKLAQGNDPQTRQILDGITLVVMPMVNPDGGELNRRASVTGWDQVVQWFPQLQDAPRAWYHSLRGGGYEQPGFDLNRDFNPDLDYVVDPADLPGRSTDAGFFLSPEAGAIRDVYVDLRAEFGEVDAFVDLHHMGPCDRATGGPQDGKLVSVTLDYPPLGVDDGAAYLTQWPDLDQDKSRRYALAVANGLLDGYGHQSPIANVARYFHPENREYAGQGRSAFALNGTGSVLFEVRGQQHNYGQKQKGMLTQTVQAGLTSLATALADGSADTLDGDRFFDLPDYGWDTASD